MRRQLQPVGGGPPVPAANAAVLAEPNASGPLQMQVSDVLSVYSHLCVRYAECALNYFVERH